MKTDAELAPPSVRTPARGATGARAAPGALDAVRALEAAAALGFPAAAGIQLVPLDVLAATPFDPGLALLVLPARGAVPAAASPIPGRNAHGAAPLSLLRRLYGDDHPVHALGRPGDERRLGDLDNAALADGAWLLPPLAPEANLSSPYGLPWLAARLRQPDGCPWDREQTHESLRKFLLEEAYEAYDALEGGATPDLEGELGDLLLQIVLHAQYAAEAGAFDLADVQRGIVTKIVRRHPHVFGEVTVNSAAEVVRNWERLKADERAARTADDPDEAAVGDPSIPAAFAGLSKTLPALLYAQEMQERAAGLGYDWPDVEGVIEKIEEEAMELLGATDHAAQREEYGDLLFVLVNLGRKLDLDAEAALRAAARKFAGRFALVERLAADEGIELRALGLDGLDDLWQRAKATEGQANRAAERATPAAERAAS